MAFILLTLMVQAPSASVDGRVAAALLFFSAGAIAALFSSFLAYINRTIRLEQPGRRENLRAALLGFAIAAVIGSGAAFMTAMNMVASTQVEKPRSLSEGLADTHQNILIRDRPAYGLPSSLRQYWFMIC